MGGRWRSLSRLDWKDLPEYWMGSGEDLVMRCRTKSLPMEITVAWFWNRHSGRYCFLLSITFSWFPCLWESLKSRHVFLLPPHSTAVRPSRCASDCMPFPREYFDFVPQHRKEIPFPQLFLYKSHFSFASLSCWSLDHVWIPRMHCACSAVRLRGGYASLGFFWRRCTSALMLIFNPVLRMSCPLTL